MVAAARIRKDIELLGEIIDVPGDEHPREQEDRRGQHQRRPDPVHTQVERDPEFLRPLEPLDELESARVRIVGEERIERGQQRDAGGDRGHQADLERLPIRHEEQDSRAQERREQDDEEGVIAHTRLLTLGGQLSAFSVS